MPGRRASTSAIKIARVVAFIGQHPELEPLLPEGAYEETVRILAAAGKIKPWMLRLFRASWFNSYYLWLERHTMPGQVLHIALRKRFFDDETRAAIAAGATQVLAVGAGFDSLCVRLAAEYPALTFVEVDHPPTHALKKKSVEAIDAMRPNLHLLGADLSTAALDEVLAGSGAWGEDEKSVVLAEGVLMYLPEPAVSEFLRTVHRCTATGSTLVFSHMRLDPDGEFQLGMAPWLTKLALKVTREPLGWGVRDGELGAFLERHGFRLRSAPGQEELQDRYLEPAGLGHEVPGEVELLALAESV